RGNVRARGPARRPGARARPPGYHARPPAARRSRTPGRVPGRATGGNRGTDRSGNTMTNAIEIRQLHYRAGRAFELKQLDLNVPSGAIYGFLGPNGSGKTTTIRLVLGLLRRLAGRITVLGDAMPDAAPRVLAHVGYVPEQPHLDPTLTVRETLRFQAAFYPNWGASATGSASWTTAASSPRCRWSVSRTGSSGCASRARPRPPLVRRSRSLLASAPTAARKRGSCAIGSRKWRRISRRSVRP